MTDKDNEKTIPMPEEAAPVPEAPQEGSAPADTPDPEQGLAPEQEPAPAEPSAPDEPSDPAGPAPAPAETPAPEVPQAPSAPDAGGQEPDSKDPPAAARSAARRLPVWLRVALGVLCVVLILLALAVGYINGKLDLIHYNDGSVDSVGTIDAAEDQDLDGTGLAHNDGEMIMPEGSPFEDADVLNVLLISTDERTEAVNDADAFTHLNELDGTRATTEYSADARADSLILASLNIQEDTIKLVSIERATGVPILLEEYEDQYDWITHTFRYGGARLTMDTVEECFNVNVDHYVRFNFNSFVQIVDAVGGIDLELTELEAAALNWEVPSNSMLIIGKVHAGLNHLDGYTALQYARLRSIDNDWKRIERQRTVIQAVLDQIQHASVTELDELLNTVLPLVQTNFTKAEIAALLVQLPGFLGVQADQMSIPVDGTYGVRTGMDDRTMYDPDWQVNSDILQDFLYEGLTAEEAIAAHVTELTATGETAEPAPVLDLSDMQAYLTANSGPVDPEQGITGEDFGNGNYRVFLAGAPQDTGAYWAMKQAPVRYLHESQGVNVLMEDCGPAAALAMQRSIETAPDARFASQEESEYWSWLADYNEKQLESGKFTIVGLGVDDDADLALTGIATLLEEEVDEDELSGSAARVLLIALQDGSAQRANSSYRILYRLQLLAEGDAVDRQDLELMFGQNTDLALELVQGVLNAASDTSTPSERFEAVWQQYDDQNFFGMFAPEQALLAPADLDGDGQAPQTTLAMAIDGGSTPVAGKVCSILGVYLDTEEEGQQPAAEAVDAQSLYEALVEAEELAAELEGENSEDDRPVPTPTPDPEGEEETEPGPAYFLALDGANSPYASENGILTDEVQNEVRPAAEYFQKLMLVPFAQDCTPMETDD